jgi:DNA-binding HxlR family transcriptional regulator
MKTRNLICPICYFLDHFGDKWSLLILRDILVNKKSRYGEFLESSEKIATNILADRLKWMVEQNLLTRAVDPENGTQAIYRPTRKAKSLQPVLEAMAQWSAKNGPETFKPYLRPQREGKRSPRRS